MTVLETFSGLSHSFRESLIPFIRTIRSSTVCQGGVGRRLCHIKSTVHETITEPLVATGPVWQIQGTPYVQHHCRNSDNCADRLDHALTNVARNTHCLSQISERVSSFENLSHHVRVWFRRVVV